MSSLQQFANLSNNSDYLNNSYKSHDMSGGSNMRGQNSNIQGEQVLIDIISNNELLNKIFNTYQLDINRIMDRLNINDEMHRQRTLNWKSFINDSKQFIQDKELDTPLEILHELKKTCQSSLNRIQKQCLDFNQWKEDKTSLAHFIHDLQQVKRLDVNGLSNTDIEQILDIYEKNIKIFKSYGILTSDFMVCDIQKRFNNQDMNMSDNQLSKLRNQIMSQESTIDIDKKQGNVLGKINATTFKDLQKQGIEILGAVINTDTCLSGGMHWTALVINLKNLEILLLNSVGEYEKELEPVRIYCRELKQLMEQVYQKEVKLEFLEDIVQTADNTCGVFCLMFITCQILGIDYKQLYDQLHNDKEEAFTSLFKRLLLG